MLALYWEALLVLMFWEIKSQRKKTSCSPVTGASNYHITSYISVYTVMLLNCLSGTFFRICKGSDLPKGHLIFQLWRSKAR